MNNQLPRASSLKPPLQPYLVLLVAIVLPGVGQVLNNAVARALLMLSFMMVLGYFTYHLADPHVSMIGKYSGGIFVYAISVMDAYYWAKYRVEVFKQSKN
jgi:hypothetical protein